MPNPRYEYEDIVNDDGEIVSSIDPVEGWIPGPPDWYPAPAPEEAPPVDLLPPVAPGPGPAPPGPAPPGPRPPGPGLRVPTSGRSSGGPERVFQYPDWTPPNIQFGTFTAPSWDVVPFEYEPFNPEAQPFEADPGYDFRVNEMERSYKNQKSAQGLLSTGNTLADLMKMRGGLASQEYGNVMNRRYQKWGANRDLALDKWKTGYQSESDEFNRALTGYLTAEQAKENEWLRSRDLYTTNLGKEMGSYGLNLDTSRLNVARDQGNFGNLLSLYGLMTRNMPTYTPTV